MSDEKKLPRDELDSFWKLDYLIPEKYSQHPFQSKQAHTDTSTVEVTVPVQKHSSGDKITESKGKALIPPENAGARTGEKSSIENIIKTLNMKRASELFSDFEDNKKQILNKNGGVDNYSRNQNSAENYSRNQNPAENYSRNQNPAENHPSEHNSAETTEKHEKKPTHEAAPFDPSEIKITRFDQLAELISEGNSYGRRLSLNKTHRNQSACVNSGETADNYSGATASRDLSTGEDAQKLSSGGYGANYGQTAECTSEGEKIPPRNEGQAQTEASYSGARADAQNGILYNENRCSNMEKTYKAGVICEYKPKNPLIKSVKVSVWPSRYTFYERFRSDAAKFFTEEGKKTEFVPFFAYIPQYQQLNHDQRRYYFWWRDCVRHGEYLRTDISYILLYVYEIINLPELIPSDEGSKLLCDVWLAYRSHYPKLDGYLSEWYCDYCLVNRIEPLFDRLSPALGDIITAATFKEFYIKSGDGGTPDFQQMLLMFYTCSYYNYKAGRYYSQAQISQTENDTPTVEQIRNAYDTHIPAAFEYAVRRLTSAENGKNSSDGHTVKGDTVTGKFAGYDRKTASGKLTRDAFSGSLCAYNIKRRIDIEYVSYLKPSEFRIIVTDMIKYAENKVRAMLGIKARLGTTNIDEGIKSAISEYFAQFRQIKTKPKKNDTESASVPEYEKFYEAENVGISPERAAEIEKLSWSVTEMLVADENETDTVFACGSQNEVSQSTLRPSAPVTDMILPDAIEKDEKSKNSEKLEKSENGLNDVQKKALEILVLHEKSGGDFVRFARENRIMPEALCEQINEIMYELIGDSVIEENDGEFALVADYIDEIKEMIS